MTQFTRETRGEMLDEIKTRYANRALKKEELPQEDLNALLEAASLAPSCFNEQPWRFLDARGGRREALLSALTPANREWAENACALLLVCAKKTFTQNGRENPWHLSDTGCATGFLMLEAERRGLTAHPMGGFDKALARETFQIPDELDVVEVIALGRPGDPCLLSEKNRERNRPMPRKPYEELLL